MKGKAQPPAITSSKGMSAQFEPKTGTLVKLEQWDDFKYQEGERQAKADRAVLDQPKDQITLSGAARVWDTTGSTAAKTIVRVRKPAMSRLRATLHQRGCPIRRPTKKVTLSRACYPGTSRCRPKQRA